MATVEEVATKVCARCREEKGVECFYKNRTARDGLAGYCKQCQDEAQRKSKANRITSIPIARGNRTATAGRLVAHGDDKSTDQSHRDDAAAALFAASRRWAESSDREDRAGALDAVVLRATQFLQAHGRCGA